MITVTDKTDKPNHAPAEAPTIESIIILNGSAILKYCYSILCNHHDAQDAAQTTFIKAYTKKAGHNNPETLSAWLYRIAYHTCLDMLRKKKLHTLLIGRLPPQEASYETSLNWGISNELSTALAAIPPKDRALFYSRAVEDLDFKQLSDRFGQSAATLRKRYERIRKKLALLLS